MAAGKLHLTGNLAIEQGANWALTLTYRIDGTAVDLTGYTARMQARRRLQATTKLLDLTSSPAAGITLGGVAGTIAIALTAAQTTVLDPGDAVYDLELVSAGGAVTRLVEGLLTIRPEVTR